MVPLKMPSPALRQVALIRDDECRGDECGQATNFMSAGLKLAAGSGAEASVTMDGLSKPCPRMVLRPVMPP
jgi:hypothetical protein